MVAMIGKVAALWRYPASSLAGEALDAAIVDSHGVEGDRLFGVVDAISGDIARPTSPDGRWKRIAHIRARLSPDGALEISVPEYDWLPAPGVAADEAVSAFLGFPARVLPLKGEAASKDHEGPLGEARYVRAPIHLLTTASLARLSALHPSGVADPARFRPNILVDMPATEGRFPETEWIGRRIAVGEVELTVAEPCRRCGFTTLSQDGFGEDAEILRNIVRHNMRNLGIYCTVDRPGRITPGDPLVLLD